MVFSVVFNVITSHLYWLSCLLACSNDIVSSYHCLKKKNAQFPACPSLLSLQAISRKEWKHAEHLCITQTDLDSTEMDTTHYNNYLSSAGYIRCKKYKLSVAFKPAVTLYANMSLKSSRFAIFGNYSQKRTLTNRTFLTGKKQYKPSRSNLATAL